MVNFNSIVKYLKIAVQHVSISQWHKLVKLIALRFCLGLLKMLYKKENENVFILIRLKRLLSSREKEPESRETELRYFLFRKLNQCYCTHNLQLCSIILLYLGNKESVKIYNKWKLAYGVENVNCIIKTLRINWKITQ